MSIYEGNVALLATSTPPATGYAWASVAASAGKCYQLLGLSGGGSSHAAAVDVLFGSTLVLSYVGATMKSGSAISEWFGNLGPVTAENQALIVRTRTQPGGTSCFANLLYRIVF